MTRHVLKSDRFAGRAFAAFILAVIVSCPPLSAAPKYDNALDWVPATAEFYSSSLRLREQFDIIVNSNAWQKLSNMPAVNMAWGFIQMGLNQPGSPWEDVQQFFAEPENQQLLDLVVDAVSHEIVVYGDKKAVDFFDVVQRAINDARFHSTVEGTSSDQAGNPEMITARMVLKSLDAEQNRLAAPNIVLGFKLTDVARAKDQLARLEKELQPVLQENNLPFHFEHSTVGGVDYLTLKLDGSMIPWDEVPWDQIVEKPGQFDALQAKLKGLTLVVSLGVRENYLILSIGATQEHLAAIGAGKLLADLPELKPVEKFSAARLTGVSYCSQTFMQVMGSPEKQMEGMVDTLRQTISQISEIPPELNERIIKDAESLAADLKGILPIPGANLSVSMLVDRGIESYRYDWSKNLELDGSKPLGLLNHVGSNPLLAYVSRSKYSPQQYDLFRKWVKKGFGYFEDFAVPQLSDEERQKYDKFKEALAPLVDRLDVATSQMIIPGFADGQGAFVLDAKATSKQWFHDLQQNGHSLPMLEPAIVLGVTDAELVKKGFTEYQNVADEIVRKIKELEPDSLPADFTIPRPEVKDAKSGTLYIYNLPAELGIDSQLAPNAGLASKVAAVSLMPTHTTQLLADSALNVSSTGPLADRNKPLAEALYFDWASTVEAATPWVDLVVKHMAEEGAESGGMGMFLTDDQSRPKLQGGQADDPSTKFVLDQVHTVLDVLKVLRTVESATAQENGAMVTHTMVEFRDVP